MKFGEIFTLKGDRIPTRARYNYSSLFIGDCKKGGLNEMYKVEKEEWLDPVVRTCGETTKVKNIDVEKQIKVPLTQKYKTFLGITVFTNLIRFAINNFLLDVMFVFAKTN